MSNMFNRHWVHGNKTPSPDWEMTGEMISTPQGPCPVYRETLPNLKKVPVVIGGEVQWLHHPTTGAKLWVEMHHVQDEDEPWIKRDFILWDNGSGMTYKNYGFRPSEADVARKSAQEQLTPELMLEKFVSMQKELEELRDQINDGPEEVFADETGDDGIDLEAELALEPTLE